MSRPVCGMCMCLIDETGCGCNGQAEELMEIMESNNEPVDYPPLKAGGIIENNEPVAWIYGNTVSTNMLTGGTPLYTHPAKHLSLQKVDGELVAVTYTDDEHRIIEVLWEKPPAKTLKDEEILDTCIMGGFYDRIDDPFFDKKTGAWSLDEDLIEFAKAILKKASEK